MLILGDFAHHHWNSVPVTEHAGEIGTAFQQTLIAGPYRDEKCATAPITGRTTCATADTSSWLWMGK